MNLEEAHHIALWDISEMVRSAKEDIWEGQKRFINAETCARRKIKQKEFRTALGEHWIDGFTSVPFYEGDYCKVTLIEWRGWHSWANELVHV